VVPHFERCCTTIPNCYETIYHGYQSFVREDFVKTARQIIGWLDTTMTDRERGGFFASQDADIDLDDDGDYFTWTVERRGRFSIRRSLTLLCRYYDIGELGDMHHNPAKTCCM